MAFIPSRVAVNSAPVGYKGRVIFFGIPVRATSSSLDAKQPITLPTPVSNVPEQPMWHVSPVTVEGDIVFPLTDEAGLAEIIKRAVTKQQKRLIPGDVQVEWPPASTTGGFTSPGSVSATRAVISNYGRLFSGCIINRLGIRATAEGTVVVTAGIMGIGIEEVAVDEQEWQSLLSRQDVGLNRVITWNEVSIAGIPTTQANASSCWVTEIGIDINNNCSHNWTFNTPGADGRLVFPRSITTGLREISGSLNFLGTAPTQDVAIRNLINYTSQESLDISLVPARRQTLVEAGPTSLVSQPSGGLLMRFNRVVYEWQDLEINAGVVTSQVKWHAHGDGPGTAAAELFTYG